MATYRSIAAAETDPLAPLIAQLMKALEMNPRAIAEGVAGAPRVWLPALERLAVGTSIRFRRDSAHITSSSTFTLVQSFTLDFIQAGTVTIAFEHRVNVNTSEVRVVRRRAAVDTTLTTISQTGTTYVAKTYDADVQPGDRITLTHRNTNSGTDSDIRNCRLQVAADNFYWPVSNIGEVEGNPTIASP